MRHVTTTQLTERAAPMTATVFPPVPAPILPISGEEAGFPVHRIFCVGRNYADHAAEMGHEVDREAPFYFTKSAHTVLHSGQDSPYPPRTNDFHHEMELVVAIGKGGKNIALDDAMDHVFGYAASLDMTRRDLQAQAKDKRRPWDTSKDFENGAVIAPLVRAENMSDLPTTRMTLTVNGKVRQDTTFDLMVWSIPEIIADLSTLYTLQPGDIIMTGTPAGVAPVVKGDVLEGRVGDLPPVKTTIV